MSDPSPGLYLVTPVLTEAEPFLPTLREALASAAIASLLYGLSAGRGRQTHQERKIGSVNDILFDIVPEACTSNSSQNHSRGVL